MKNIVWLIACLFLFGCVTASPKHECDTPCATPCEKPTCEKGELRGGVISDHAIKAERDQAEKTKKMIEEEGYSIIPPTATESLRKQQHTDPDSLHRYRMISIPNWHYFTSTFKRGTQVLEINLPEMVPDINLKDVQVGLGIPIVGKFKVRGDSIQCVYFSCSKPLYLKTAIMAFRIYGNLTGFFKPSFIVATKRYPGTAKEHWWRYDKDIPIPISAEEGHLAIKKYIMRELGRWKDV